MNWLDPFFVTLGLSGLCFLFVGWLTNRKPPANINHLYGYRTPASMASQERWDFAQRVASGHSFQAGVMMLLLAFAGSFAGMNEIVGVLLAVAALIVLCVAMIMRVERELKTAFGPVPRGKKKAA